MSLPIGITDHNSITGLPLTLKSLNVSRGPAFANWSGHAYNAGDPNEDGWETNYWEVTQYVSATKSTISSGFYFGNSEYEIIGKRASAILFMEPFTSDQLDRLWTPSTTIASAHADISLGTFSIKKTVSELQITASEPTSADYWQLTGGIPGEGAYWGRTDTVTTESTGNVTMGLMGLYVPASGSELDCRVLTNGGTTGNDLGAGDVVGIDLKEWVKAYLADGDGAVAFCLFPSVPGVPQFDPVDVDSAAGMEQMLDACHSGDITYLQDNNDDWWPTGTITFYEFSWKQPSFVAAFAKLNGLGSSLDSRCRPAPGLIPRFDS